MQWVEAQNKKTNAYLATLESREFLKQKLTEKYNYAKTGATFVAGEGDMKRYYYYKNNGLQNQYALYCSKSYRDDGELFFDPNTLAADGTCLQVSEAPVRDLLALNCEWLQEQRRSAQLPFRSPARCGRTVSPPRGPTGRRSSKTSRKHTHAPDLLTGPMRASLALCQRRAMRARGAKACL